MAEVERSTGELVAAARQGDALAFAALVRAERAALVRTARGILGDPHEAEDAAQDALVAAWRHLDDLRDPGRFHAWVVTILMRTARRRRRVRPRTAADLSGLPARETTADPRLAALAREVDRLPDRHRLPLVLHYLGGLDYAGVAAALGIPAKRVKSRLYEAREKIRRRMGHGRS